MAHVVRLLAEVRDRTAREVVTAGLPSLAVAVSRDGEILWEEGFGWADRARGVRATEHTPYSIASITKPITATALMLLVERGAIDLDAPIDLYLGGARVKAYGGIVDGGAPTATVRHVATHTAGLPLHYQFFYADEPYRAPARSETIRRYATLVTPPGERFQYSNLGYGLLDFAISEASGTSYADFLRTEVFAPLGMHRTTVHVHPQLGDESATRYGADGVAYPFYDFDHPGGSAVFASAHDLLRFALASLDTPLDDQRAVLPSRVLTDMRQTAAGSSAGYGYGIGWSSYDDEGGYETCGHTGGMGGVSTVLAMVPSERIAVVALANASSAIPQWVRAEVLAALLPQYAGRRDDAFALLLGTDVSTPPPPEIFRSLAGRWEGEIGTYAGTRQLTLEFRDGDAQARIDRQLRTLVNRLRWDGERLTGTMFGDIGTDDARRRPHHIALDLCMRDETLDGCATALTHLPDGEGGAPGKRAGNALSHWVRLGRAGGAEGAARVSV